MGYIGKKKNAKDLATQSDVVDVLKKDDVLDVLNDTSTDKALSANMGRELAVRIDASNGSGGFIDPYDFGTATPTQQALTDYAMGFIFKSDAANHDPLEIFNGTKVQNLNDKRVWQLANTPATDPAIFEWMVALVVSEAQRNFTENPIETAEITDAAVTEGKLAVAIRTLLGYIDTNGSIAEAITNALANYVPSSRKIAGLDLSADQTAAALKTALGLTNDFDNTYKTLLDFLKTTRTVTSLSSLAMATCQTVYASISANQSLSCSGTPPVGQVVHVYVRNAGTTNRTIVIPTTGSYISMSGASATLPASGYLEINIAYDTSDSKYKIVVIEKA
jgi:hypothetical protein